MCIVVAVNFIIIVIYIRAISSTRLVNMNTTLVVDRKCCSRSTIKFVLVKAVSLVNASVKYLAIIKVCMKSFFAAFERCLSICKRRKAVIYNSDTQ